MLRYKKFIAILLSSLLSLSMFIFAPFAFADNNSGAPFGQISTDNDDSVQTGPVDSGQNAVGTDDNNQDSKEPVDDTDSVDSDLSDEDDAAAITDQQDAQSPSHMAEEDELTPQATVEPTLKIEAHVQNRGWLAAVGSGATAGTTGQALRLEALKINLDADTTTYPNAGISYQAHVKNIGNTAAANNGGVSGTTGRGLSIESLNINLTGGIEADYSVYYRVHVANIGWLNWAKDGQWAGSKAFAYQAEAVQVVLVNNTTGTPPASSGSRALMVGVDAYPNNTVQALGHIQGIGNNSKNGNGLTIGSTGQGRRLEAILINYTPGDSLALTGGISYNAHVQSIGWQGWKGNGELAGTTARALRLEAVQIKLTGELAQYYNVYYRAHVEEGGWLGWATNGQTAGSTKQALRMEAVQVLLVPKAGAAPGGGNPTFKITARLNVQLLNQLPNYPTGCEAASTAMMIRYAGHNVSVDDIVNRMPYSSNPDQGFVGNPRTWSGYTIFPPALLGVVRSYTGSAVNLTGASLNTFKDYLNADKPVVCWIQTGSGLHCVCITGYDRQNFYYNDPYGRKDVPVSYASLSVMRMQLGNRALSY
jgi:uncharacterized protein YjdB/uncharacterized protein YvpB